MFDLQNAYNTHNMCSLNNYVISVLWIFFISLLLSDSKINIFGSCTNQTNNWLIEKTIDRSMENENNDSLQLSICVCISSAWPDITSFLCFWSFLILLRSTTSHFSTSAVSLPRVHSRPVHIRWFQSLTEPLHCLCLLDASNIYPSLCVCLLSSVVFFIFDLNSHQLLHIGKFWSCHTLRVPSEPWPAKCKNL